MVRDELKTRGQIRVEREHARLTIQVEERRAVLEKSLIRERRERDVALHRLTIQARQYPLGIPGRFSDSVPRRHPVVLISPHAGIDALAYDRLRDAPGITRYADLLTGAFASDGGVPRTIRGVSGAQEIAAAEFTSRPSILIYFERHASGLTVFAYLAGLFATVDDDRGFPIRVAKFITDGDRSAPPAATPSDTDLPTWQRIDISGWQGSREEVIADTITWFIFATLESYWMLQGVTGTGLLASVFPPDPQPENQQPENRQPENQQLGSPLLRRLETEMSCLAQAGYELDESVDFGDRQVAVLARKGDVVIAFAVGEDYPRKPPLVFTFGAHGEQRFDIGAETWTPDRNFLEIAESLT